MDIEFELNEASFKWDVDKATSNIAKHGIAFEHAAQAFFDPEFRTIEADRNDELRDALIGFDAMARLLFVVHIEFGDGHIRLISARRATAQERDFYSNT